MKIAVDVRCLMEGRRTGVEEYALGLLEELFNLDKKNEYILFFNSWKEPRFDFSYFSKFENVRIKRLKIPNKLLNFCFWYFGWPKIDRLCGGVEVFFSPNISFGVVSQKVKKIITIHDLSFERHSEYFSRKRRWWHIFINPRRICLAADRIIAVSDSTRNDVGELYGIRKEKIETVPNAVAEKFRIIDRNEKKMIQIKEKYELPYKFILFLGTIEPRKNIVGLVRAYDALQKYARENNLEEIEKYKLVIAGEYGWKNKKIFQEIAASEFREKIQMINFVEDADKEYVYNLAALFVYPSFFEGFGFPPLEAMKCGVPVITTNNSSLPEVAGEAAILIDPDKPEEIYRAMKEVLINYELRNDLIRKGFVQAIKFSWRKTAEQTLRILTK